jgi:crotonobetainyl-CoA:carnitine CoA-transferase CaiB-like acyl-CoA transferase
MMKREILPANKIKKGENVQISVRNLLQNIRAFFRGFTEEDACALLSAYGLCVFELHRLHDDSSDPQKEENQNFDDASRPNYTGFPGLAPIGVHPDITRVRRTMGWRKRAHR